MTLDEIEEEYIIKSRKKVTDWFLRERGVLESLVVCKRYPSYRYYIVWKMGKHYTKPVHIGYTWKEILLRANQEAA